MKKFATLLVCLVISLVAMSQKSVIGFDNRNHDFGKVNEEDGKITHVFNFTNKGATPLVINRVQASCGCTTPEWTKEPIVPGKSGTISVSYNPAGRPGAFVKDITVYSNSTEDEIILTIKGEVLSKLSADNNPYGSNMNGLLVKSNLVQMSSLEKGKIQTKILEIKNSLTVNIKPTIENLPAHITVAISPENLKPNEEGKITFTFNSKNSTKWGPTNDEVFVVVNGQKKFSNDLKITVKSNIIEDFGSLTLEQKRKAPILEIPQKVINLAAIKIGSKKSGKFRITNKGLSNLEIRRIINSNDELIIRHSKLSIPSGKSAEILIDLNTKNLAVGEYKKYFTLQTNDPNNSFVILAVSWSIQK